jgi:hypothetical protein
MYKQDDGCCLPLQALSFHPPIFSTLKDGQTLPGDLLDQPPLFHLVVSLVQQLPAGHC